ncbi:hypothetical protein AT1219_10744 [Vibrio alginolyticus]
MSLHQYTHDLHCNRKKIIKIKQMNGLVYISKIKKAPKKTFRARQEAGK